MLVAIKAIAKSVTPRRAPSRVSGSPLTPWGGAEAGTAASGRDRARHINFVRRGARSVVLLRRRHASKRETIESTSREPDRVQRGDCGACDKYTTGRFHSHTGSSYNGSIQAVDMGCQPLDTLLSLPSSGFPPAQETVEIGDETLGGSHCP